MLTELEHTADRLHLRCPRCNARKSPPLRIYAGTNASDWACGGIWQFVRSGTPTGGISVRGDSCRTVLHFPERLTHAEAA